MSEKTKRITPQEAQALAEKGLESGEITPVHAVYNSVSIEHDIPIAIAEAMARSAGVYNLAMLGTSHDEERKNIAYSFAHLWLSIAENLNVPRPRMESAIKATINGVLGITAQCQKMVRKHEEGEKQCASA